MREIAGGYTIIPVNGLFDFYPELVGLRTEDVVLREMTKHVAVPLALQVGVQIATALPFFVYDYAARVVEVRRAEVVNATLFCSKRPR